MSKNDITGDSLKTRPASDAYRANWENIFKKEQTCNANAENGSQKSEKQFLPESAIQK